MDHKITEAIGAWLNTPEADRDIEAGALLLARINGNRVFLQAVKHNPEKYAATVEYQLQRQYNWRVAALTEEQLRNMVADADVKMAEAESRQPMDAADGEPTAGADKEYSGFAKGKRADHDSLPADIQKLYKDTLEYRRQMQQLHLQMRTLLNGMTPCTASDVYAYVKELLAVEKKWRSAWNRYDAYKIEN